MVVLIFCETKQTNAYGQYTQLPHISSIPL